MSLSAQPVECSIFVLITFFAVVDKEIKRYDIVYNVTYKILENMPNVSPQYAKRKKSDNTNNYRSEFNPFNIKSPRDKKTSRTHSIILK